MIVMVGTFIADVFKSTKDNKNLTKEHGGLSKEHSSLSKEHDNLSKEHDNLSKEINNHFNTVIQQNIKQTEAISEINKEIYGEIKKRDIQFDNLTVSQRDAYKQMEKFTFLMSEVQRLQSENVELKKKIEELNTQILEFNQSQNRNMRL